MPGITAKAPCFALGEKVEYFRRGCCYSAIITKDLGIFKGAGRKYTIVQDESVPGQSPFTFDVAEKHLTEQDWEDRHKWGDLTPPWL